MSKEERSELKKKLERMEDEGDSPEITISVISNSKNANPEKQPPMEHFEEEAAEDFA